MRGEIGMNWWWVVIPVLWMLVGYVTIGFMRACLEHEGSEASKEDIMLAFGATVLLGPIGLWWARRGVPYLFECGWKRPFKVQDLDSGRKS
jgi:hypothetical protein